MLYFLTLLFEKKKLIEFELMHCKIIQYEIIVFVPIFILNYNHFYLPFFLLSWNCFVIFFYKFLIFENLTINSLSELW